MARETSLLYLQVHALVAAAPDSPAGAARSGGRSGGNRNSQKKQKRLPGDFTRLPGSSKSLHSAPEPLGMPAPGIGGKPLVVSVVSGSATQYSSRPIPNPQSAGTRNWDANGPNHVPPNLSAQYTGCREVVKENSYKMFGAACPKRLPVVVAFHLRATRGAQQANLSASKLKSTAAALHQGLDY